MGSRKFEAAQPVFETAYQAATQAEQFLLASEALYGMARIELKRGNKSTAVPIDLCPLKVIFLGLLLLYLLILLF